MQYMIMNYVPAAKADGTLDAHGDMDAWIAYTQAMVDAGVMRGGNALKPGTTATTVRLRDGRRDVHDGPYIDSKEELGGYFVIEVADLDEALQWAARNPAASYGAVEVRPILTA
ncbi:YciI family protein [Sphingomonas sp. MMS24-J45]|uniref:YciI family protein n=1 Tax=Sphingomonas sp. MMS24-J45 TaxID=3238806 RepID=UPI0038508116